jgi:hypothetical protein
VKLFSCQRCEHVLFFENTVCTSCGTPCAYAPESESLVAVPGGDGADTFDVELPTPERHAVYRKCKNFIEHDACNWLVSAADGTELCRSCRLTGTIPDLSDAKSRAAWVDIERAKRRLLYSLYALGLPVASKVDDPSGGVQFDFRLGTEENPVMTGHDEGLITLNVAEADNAFRENMREKLGEGYRTVLGHLRHEIGHYYWNVLVRDQAPLDACRKLFGDDQQSYQDAIQRHYSQGAPANWAESFISEYATMHPWEDWAETWAHYLHMVDTLETAKSHGLTLRSLVKEDGSKAGKKVATETLAFQDYESLSTSWQAVTLALNDLNRSMGIKDAYPFVVSPTVHTKLRFVHELVQAQRKSARPRARAGAPVKSNPPGWRRWIGRGRATA